MQSKSSFDRLWMPFTSYQDCIDNPPRIIEYGSGIYVFDKEGRGYIDAIGSWWVNIFGHNNPEITDAVKKQLDKIEHIIMAGFISEPSLELSGLLGSILPKNLSRIFYSDDGSTSVEVALKIALQYHALKNSPRSEFVALGGAYHGDTLGAMSVGMVPQYHSLFHERFKKQHFTDSPYCYRCPAGKNCSSCNAECMDSLQKILEEHGEKIAACIFEPMVQGAGGMRIYPEKVLKRIFSLCKQYDILTIDDEVAMGFGRTGKMFACEHAGKTPDIMCLAKGLTAGYLPLAATVVNEKIFKEFQGDYKSNRTFFHGHSFTGNPLASAAACASMKLLTNGNIPQSLSNIIEKFSKGLSNFNKFDIVGDVRSLGMVGAIELVKDRKSKEKIPADLRFAHKVTQRALKYGLLIRPLGDIIYFMPPYIITEEQIENMFFLTEKALKETIDENISDLR